MDARVEQSDGSFLTENREPICGQDFCDACGDCLHCSGGDECLDDSDGHVWMIYR